MENMGRMLSVLLRIDDGSDEVQDDQVIVFAVAADVFYLLSRDQTYRCAEYW